MYKNTIFLLDLDHTLYNADEPWKKIVDKIFVKNIKWKKFSWEVYFKIRQYYEIFDLFFEKSFRHYWLSKELISLLFGIKDNKISSSNLLRDLEALDLKISLLRKIECRPSVILSKSLKYATEYPELWKTIQLIESQKDNEEVNQTENEFNSEVHLNCFKGVRELLELLSENKDKFYLASEGDYELQLWKTQLLGINHFFNGKILATELYKHNKEYQNNLIFIKGLIRKKNYSSLIESKEVQRADDIIKKYEILRSKENMLYYYALFRAIKVNPREPEKAFLNMPIDELMNYDEHPRGRVVMIGDRVDKDMLPIWRISGKKSVLLRIRAGKYKDDSTESIPKENYFEFKNFNSIFLYIRDVLN